MGYKEDFIDFMVHAGVLTFGDFVTKSGRNTPYFVNTGNYQTSEQISKLGQYYAACLMDRIDISSFNMLYGPAYKGIPLVIATATSLYRDHGIDIAYAFNRKEVKDHGEGGSLIGYKPKDGDKVIIVEDVITAGTSIRESVPLLKSYADVDVNALVISVDRMEKGQSNKTAISEVKEDFGIETHAIVTVKEIIAHLHGRELMGQVVIDDDMKNKMENYLKTYGI
ncbi:MAG: orotate phosphoribosyltransferase [Eubacteriaceae bacterium]|jgi:orotate phosphoribosyltransferase|nr:orotate phosphoribosyltransferase [Eubacteriaceae bacterium]